MNDNIVKNKKYFILEAINRGYTYKEIASIFSISFQGVHSYVSSVKNKISKFDDDLIPIEVKNIKGKLSDVDSIILCLELINVQENFDCDLKQAINILKRDGINFKESTNRVTYNNVRYKNVDDLLDNVFPDCSSRNVFFYEINKYMKENKCSKNDAVTYVFENRDKIFNRGFVFEDKYYKNKKDAILKLLPDVKYENVCSLISQYQRMYGISRNEAFTKAINKYRKK